MTFAKRGYNLWRKQPYRQATTGDQNDRGTLLPPQRTITRGKNIFTVAPCATLRSPDCATPSTSLPTQAHKSNGVTASNLPFFFPSQNQLHTSLLFSFASPFSPPLSFASPRHTQFRLFSYFSPSPHFVFLTSHTASPPLFSSPSHLFHSLSLSSSSHHLDSPRISHLLHTHLLHLSFYNFPLLTLPSSIITSSTTPHFFTPRITKFASSHLLLVHHSSLLSCILSFITSLLFDLHLPPITTHAKPKTKLDFFLLLLTFHSVLSALNRYKHIDRHHLHLTAVRILGQHKRKS